MTVYVVQKQMKFDQTRKELVPRFTSIGKAERWGEIRYLLPPSANPFNPDLATGDLHEGLSGFSDNDHLLLIGSPVLIGIATAIAAYYNEGRVRLLQWSGRNNEYTEVKVKIY